MDIPYKEIISLIKYKKEMDANENKEFKLFTFLRKKFIINPIISVLNNSIDKKDTTIYKKDIVNFFLFLHDLKDITGEFPLGLKTDQEDSINYKLTIIHNGYIGGDYYGKMKKYHIEISTIDTALQVNSYFKVKYQIEADDRILVSKQYETTYMDTKDSAIGYITYMEIINTIIRYMKMYLLGE